MLFAMICDAAERPNQQMIAARGIQPLTGSVQCASVLTANGDGLRTQQRCQTGWIELQQIAAPTPVDINVRQAQDGLFHKDRHAAPGTEGRRPAYLIPGVPL